MKVKKSGIRGLAHTLRCAFSGVIARLADLKGLRQPNFHTFSGLGVKIADSDHSRATCVVSAPATLRRGRAPDAESVNDALGRSEMDCGESPP